MATQVGPVLDPVPLVQAPQPELSFHPLPGASSRLKQIPEMLLPPNCARRLGTGKRRRDFSRW